MKCFHSLYAVCELLHVCCTVKYKYNTRYQYNTMIISSHRVALKQRTNIWLGGGNFRVSIILMTSKLAPHPPKKIKLKKSCGRGKCSVYEFHICVNISCQRILDQSTVKMILGSCLESAQTVWNYFSPFRSVMQTKFCCLNPVCACAC